MRYLALLLLSTTAYADSWVDKPTWPQKATTASLKWVVKPAAKDTAKRPVALEVTSGDVTRSIALSPTIGLIKCGHNAIALDKGEVAKLTFEYAGFGGYAIARTDDVLAVVAWSQTDGLCTDGHGKDTACPVSKTAIAKLHVPAAWKLDEQIVELDDHGVRHPFPCTD